MIYLPLSGVQSYSCPSVDLAIFALHLSRVNSWLDAIDLKLYLLNFTYIKINAKINDYFKSYLFYINPYKIFLLGSSRRSK